MATKEDPAEVAVHHYLMFRDNPEVARDANAVKAAQAALDKAKDPLDRVKARAALRAAESVDGAPIVQAFVEHAKAWAEANGVSAADLLAEGADARDLVAAGLKDAPKGKVKATTKGGTRAPRLDFETEVMPKVPLHEFKVSDLAHALGRDTTTTRNYVNKLLATGFIAEVGEDTSGSGRAAKLYQRV